MTLVTYFPNTPHPDNLPRQLESPFSDTPHPLARLASEQLQQHLKTQTTWHHDFNASDGGKMLGVLVVLDTDKRVGFISAFSGMLAGQWTLPGFVPPVFDLAERARVLSESEAELFLYTRQIQTLQKNKEYRELQKQLIELNNKRDHEWQALKSAHTQRKAARKEQRARLKSLDIANDKQLAHLSYASQQDKREQRAFQTRWRAIEEPLQNSLAVIDNQIERLTEKRTDLSRALHNNIFSSYLLTNRLGDERPLVHFYQDSKPPAGAGDCAAPKLLHYAQQQGLKPLAIAEFWWGSSPADGIRHHAYYYPACRSKCRPILPFMLTGLQVNAPPVAHISCHENNALQVVYEDTDLLVVNKPSGLLSVPGKEIYDSVLTRLKQRYPDASGPLLLHRLDQSTSGLLIATKNTEAHKILQKQFLVRSIEKRYVAVLSRALPADRNEGVTQSSGTISLPLRVDLEDRPRQMVCISHGKPAITRWRIIQSEAGSTRVYFYPVTGRTHQLRMHAAHKDGLNAPIVGDELYGEKAERLLLHAERLRFRHPATGKQIEIVSPPPF